MDSQRSIEPYFDDPRLGMTVAGRAFVRIAGQITYVIVAAAAAMFIISDVTGVRFFGILLALIIIDRIAHRGEADKPLSELPRRGLRLNIANYLTPQAFTAVERAYDKSVILGRDFYLELALELMHYAEVHDGLRRLDVKLDEFKQKAEELLRAGESNGGSSRTDIKALVSALMEVALSRAIENSHRFVSPADLFAAFASLKDDSLSRIFALFSIEPGDLERTLIFSYTASQYTNLRRVPREVGGFLLDSQRRMRHRIMNRAWTSRPTPVLDRYSSDLTDLARLGTVGFLIGHEKELERLIDTLARPINPNALLVGPAGIGKEALIHHLAYLLTKDEVPSVLFDRRLVMLELGSLVAGAAPEELHLRLQKIVEEIFVAGNIILCAPDIHNLVATSGTAYLSAADTLMPVIMNNAFPIVGLSYPKEFKQLIEPRSDFVGAFETIRIEEISAEDAQKILVYESLILERRHKVVISFGAVKKSVEIAKKFFHQKFLPSSAEEILKSAIVEVNRRGENFVGPDAVIRAAEAKVNIPIHEATEVEAQKLLNLEDIIHERLIGQAEAVKAVADALRESRSGLARKGGPIASFLFVGPTGVGKTELAKILTKIQFGSSDLMVRFDMTEYQDKTSFYRFIGSPDGKISGTLTDAILAKPYSLILLDEFEKSFPDILDLFLQVLDDGRLTDNLGRTVDFTNTVVIATSNAHSDIINDALNKGESMSDISEYLKKKLVDVFKPELLNRFSKVVVFKNLSPDDLEKVVALNLKELADLIAEQGITLSFDPEVYKRFARIGFDPAFGARPLRRVIDEKLRAGLAQKILTKEVTKGSRVRLVSDGDEFKFISES